MSREIKFRIWDEKKKEWLGASDNNTLTYYGFHLVGEVMTVQAPPQWALDDGMVVEQFTGLKDKNGKEIYEGDIVNIFAFVDTDDSDMTCIMDTNSIVRWDKEHARWDVNDEPESKDWDYRRRRYFVFVDSEGRENVEVIGNIHQSPDLIRREG